MIWKPRRQACNHRLAPARPCKIRRTDPEQRLDQRPQLIQQVAGRPGGNLRPRQPCPIRPMGTAPHMSMSRIDWEHLPEHVHHAVEVHTGPVIKAETVSGGKNSQIAACVSTADQLVFVKGMPSDHPQHPSQQREAAINPYVAPAWLPRSCGESRTAGGTSSGSRTSAAATPTTGRARPTCRASCSSRVSWRRWRRRRRRWSAASSNAGRRTPTPARPSAGAPDGRCCTPTSRRTTSSSARRATG